MRLEYLKVFIDLGRYRSFSRAAQVNSISQSAVSQVVSQMEKHLGVILVDRSTRPLQLTEPGKLFCAGCKSLIEQYRQLESTVCESHARLVSNVQVAAIYSVGLRDMSRYIECFQHQHPGAEVHIEYLHPKRVYEKVLEGSADFGLVSYPRRSRSLTILPWREEEMLLACSPHHELAHHTSLKLTQLNGAKYIGFTRDLSIRQRIDQFLRQRGISVDVILEFDNIEYVKKAIEIGNGVALLPEPMLQREVESGILAAVPIAGCRLVRPLSIVYLRNHKLSPAASSFADLLRQPESPQVGANSAKGKRRFPKQAAQSVTSGTRGEAPVAARARRRGLQ
jgi:DNA-binding transcriptional LysR family regulator